jgi:uncharacterized protein (TIRG00374 family)
LKAKLLTFLKLVLALGLGLLIAYLSLKDLSSEAKKFIIDSFKLANYYLIFLSILIGILSHYVRAIRWKMLLKPMGYSLSTKTSFLAVMVGYFANLGIPRSGEVARCSVLYTENKIPVDKSFGTVIVERSIDMILFFSLFLFIFLIEHARIYSYVSTQIFPFFAEKFSFIQSKQSLIFIMLAIGILLTIPLIIFRKRLLNTALFKKIINLFSGLFEGLLSIVKIKQPILFIFYSILIWTLYFLMTYTIMLSLPQTSHLGISAGISVLVLGSIGIMVTPGGIGLYPVIVAQTLVLYGISAESGYGDAIGWISWSAQTIMIIVVGAISLLVVSIHKKKRSNES